MLCVCMYVCMYVCMNGCIQVLVAAANPPVKYYSFFLTSLLETVRINIGTAAAY